MKERQRTEDVTSFSHMYTCCVHQQRHVFRVKHRLLYARYRSCSSGSIRTILCRIGLLVVLYYEQVTAKSVKSFDFECRDVQYQEVFAPADVECVQIITLAAENIAIL